MNLSDFLFYSFHFSGRSSVDGSTGSRPAEQMISSSYRIPNRADLLIYTAAFSGHFAFRNEKTGSWMIQSLCYEINKSRPDEDLASILTSVSRSVAKKESSCSNDQDLHGKKQVPMKQAKLYVSGYPMFYLEARFQAHCCFSSNNWKKNCLITQVFR